MSWRPAKPSNVLESVPRRCCLSTGLGRPRAGRSLLFLLLETFLGGDLRRRIHYELVPSAISIALLLLPILARGPVTIRQKDGLDAPMFQNGKHY